MTYSELKTRIATAIRVAQDEGYVETAIALRYVQADLAATCAPTDNVIPLRDHTGPRGTAALGIG